MREHGVPETITPRDPINEAVSFVEFPGMNFC